MKKIYTITDKNFKSFVFSGGEVHIDIDNQTALKFLDRNEYEIEFDIRIKSSDDLMKLYLLNAHYQSLGFDTSANILYMPYARQDRQTTNTNLHSLKHFARLINSCNFIDVTVADPHSLAVENSIRNCRVIPMHSILDKLSKRMNEFLSYDGRELRVNYFESQKIIFIAPDIGAFSKVKKCAEVFGVPFIACNKIRNPANGEITGIEVLGKIPEGFKNAFVLDDICDGGATFIELLDKTDLKQKFEHISLYVTHGIFSKGVDKLIEAGYNSIYTTDSFCEIEHKNLLKINL